MSPLGGDPRSIQRRIPGLSGAPAWECSHSDLYPQLVESWRELPWCLGTETQGRCPGGREHGQLLSLRMTSWRTAPRVTEGGPACPGPCWAAWPAVFNLQCVPPPRAPCGRCCRTVLSAPARSLRGRLGVGPTRPPHLPGQGRPRPQGRAGPLPGLQEAGRLFPGSGGRPAGQRPGLMFHFLPYD